jgi:hypothetical protein
MPNDGIPTDEELTELISGAGRRTGAVGNLVAHDVSLTCLMSYLTMRIGTYERLAAGILYPLRQAQGVVLVTVMGLQRLILGRQTILLLLSADRGQGRAARSSLHRPSSGPQT